MPVSPNLNAVLNYERKLLIEDKFLMSKKGKLMAKQGKLKSKYRASLIVELRRFLNVPIFDFSKTLIKDEKPFHGVMSSLHSIDKTLETLERKVLALETDNPDDLVKAVRNLKEGEDEDLFKESILKGYKASLKESLKKKGMGLKDLKEQLLFVKSLLTPKDGYTTFDIEYMKSVRSDEKGMFVAVTEQPDGYVIKVMTAKKSISFFVKKTDYMDFDLGYAIGTINGYFPEYKK